MEPRSEWVRKYALPWKQNLPADGPMAVLALPENIRPQVLQARLLGNKEFQQKNFQGAVQHYSTALELGSNSILQPIHCLC